LNLLLLEPGEIAAGGNVRLGGRRAKHLIKVLRVEPGRELRLGVLGGGQGTGRVLAASGGEVELAVEVRGEPPPRPWIDLIVALPRPAVLHRVLQTAAAMTVGRLDLTAAWRVEKSFFSSPALGEGAIRRHLVLGAEQGMVTRLPEVRLHRLLVPFVRELEARTEPPRRLLAHPGAAEPFEAVFQDADRVEIAIGPEGGWIDRELETFEAAGFAPFSLGPWILRSEAAVTSALAQVELLRRLRTGSRRT
jgi:RsmE family RNA methyltransferase